MTNIHEAPVVSLNNVIRTFSGQNILDGVDLDIYAGEFVALLGRSGSGKTTLLRLLGGLDNSDGGAINAPQKRATVFQEPRLMPWKKAWSNVTLGLQGDKKSLREQALHALGEVGLAHRVNAYPATLSGGEAQRVALARSLVREPELLLLDEPFAALDALTRIKAHQLIQQLWAAHKPAVLIVTHDVDEAILLADRILILENGRINHEINIRAARPRHVASREFQTIRHDLLTYLGVDLPPQEMPDKKNSVYDARKLHTRNADFIKKAASA